MPARRDPPTGDVPDDNAAGADPSDEARWAEIVAELGDLESDGHFRAEDDAAADPSRPVTYPVAPWVSDTRSGHGTPLTGRDWDGTDQIDHAESEVDDAEHFQPPDPGPVLSGNPLLTLAWGGAVGAPILLLVLLVIGQGTHHLVAQIAAGVFVASCAVLIWRMPPRRNDDDGDNGAVV